MMVLNETTVFAIAPTSRGFGYVLFAARAKPLDWGVKEIRNEKNRQSLAKIEAMIRTILPAVVVLEDREHRTCRRSLRVRVLLHHIAALAEAQGLTVATYSRRDVRAAFGKKGKSKDAIAGVIVEEVPALLPWLPRRRRIWESEQHSMAIFEAAALAMVHYDARRVAKKEEEDQTALL
ncbi:hypothetical protein JDN40_14930 [Rhodomicrobium vannielii ATCC 17100]|uniref:hypothetical protein n=1 Tax=Rhodomicrobium vannielii TaxID=1069 RepID=UPI0019184CEB|nr:hypothetical protein [Rhodomicrobium vannielii]MBJ7535402.1 hypothetical protein [Rhodomicrobium vannielii ATCC 17100]